MKEDMALARPGCLVFCLAMFWQVNGVQGAIVTNPSSIDGVAFIGPSEPSFNDAVTKVLGFSPTLTTNDWLPFSAVLTNNTSEPIVAVIVKWVKVLPEVLLQMVRMERERRGGGVDARSELCSDTEDRVDELTLRLTVIKTLFANGMNGLRT